MAQFDLESYATVQERVAQLYQDFPDASVRTFMVKLDGPEVVFEARVYRTPEEVTMGVYTSGWAREIEGKTPVNRTSFLENCESSAVGRALANLGYATDARRPSRSEMLKVARMKDEHEEMLQFIRTVGPKAPDDSKITLGGAEHDLKEFVRKNWATIKEQFRIARAVVETLEAVTETRYEQEREAP